tara:strand:+ start:1282 stop:1488 length:207 start_codon:yes stop_codon:yes gene_type:complete
MQIYNKGFKMKVENAEYIYDLDDSETKISIKVTIDGKPAVVPLDPINRHYKEIMEQVKEGTLTIKDAD